MTNPTLPTSARGIFEMSVRDLLISSVAAGKRANMYGFDIPAIPSVGRDLAEGDTDLFVVAVAVGEGAAWLKDQMALRVALSLAAGNGGTIKDWSPGGGTTAAV